MTQSIQNPYQLYKERNINALLSVGFQYLKKYKRSFFVPLIMVGVPLQMVMFYLNIDYFSGIYNSNPWLFGGNSNVFTSLFSKTLLMMLVLLISQSFSVSLIYNHFRIFTGNEFVLSDKDPQEMINVSIKLLPKSIKILILSFTLLTTLSIPLMIVFFGLIYILSVSGGLAFGIFFIFLFMILLLILIPPFFYLMVITPFTLLNKNPDESYFKVFFKNLKNVFSEFRKTWLYSFLLIILFYLAETIVMFPIIMVLISGLFIKTPAYTVNMITKIIVSSIASFIQIVVLNILIVLFLYLYGNNEEKMTKRSLKQEIENL